MKMRLTVTSGSVAADYRADCSFVHSAEVHIAVLKALYGTNLSEFARTQMQPSLEACIRTLL